MFTIQKIGIIFSLALLLVSCATPRAPEGGAKDETPPQIDSTKTTPNFQTNFEKKRIEITFGEWVKLNDVFNQVVVSPPLEKDPKISLKKKSVRFEFDEEEILRENATYTINFGEAVQDITESNSAEDLRYVFSTGDEIDSLQLSGKVLDLLTKEPLEDVLVMLYENTEDSVVRTERPFYFSKTNEQGIYKIENIKEGTFKVFALKDANLNYKFDQESEAIGFLDSLITLPDTNNIAINLSVFTEEAQLRLIDDELVHYGLAKLVFNRDPYDLKLNFTNIDPPPYTETIEDTIKIWYDAVDYFDVFLQADTSLNDTIRIPVKEKVTFLEKAKFVQLNSSVNGRPKSKNPTVPIGIEMNYPIASFDTAFIRVYEDTLRTLVYPQINVDTVDKRLLKMDFKWKENQLYEVEILPNGLTSFLGTANDTIIQSYRNLPRVDFGSLSITIDSLESDQDYIVQLLTKTKNLVQENSIRGKSVFVQEYSSLQPSEYIIKIIEDKNGNGKWDTGSYDEKRKPERIFSKQLETLRPNWTVEATIKVAF